jgi:two-component system, OmpR family, sensor kinase
VVPDISLPPSETAAGQPVHGSARELAVAPGQVLRRLSQAGGRRPDVLDLTWLLLWLLGLVCIVIYAWWATVPFRYVWITLALLTFGVLMRQAHRRQAADTERARVSEENARLLAAQRRFLQDASHQLRTPITIALGHAELLARDLAGGEHGRDIDLVVGELTRLKSLAERLLLIATSENPDFLRPEPVALDLFMMEVLRRWRPAAPRRWQLGRLDAATVSADLERLGLAVDALLENAVQHTLTDDVIRLSVRGGGRSAFSRVIVEDAGSGIARAELAYIFDRFRSGSTPDRTRGTGLGLALARAIAHGHGGEVLVRSEPGAGSTFELVLPATAPPSAVPAEITTPAQAGDPCGNMRT